MILRDDKFDASVSSYERPNFPFKCGRAAAWGKPCFSGPNADGSCGGVTECQPHNNDGRWLCRRSAAAGGACTDGPLPDGTCCSKKSACQPRTSLRRTRGRLGIMVAVLVVAAIAGFSFSSNENNILASSIDAGPLSNVHAKFTANTGCGSCHDAFDKGADGWVDAALHGNGPSEKCSDCHTFNGQANTAHNMKEPKSGTHSLPNTNCTMCHTEHKGEMANITSMNDTQCMACHEKKFDSFAVNHTEFSKTYPFKRRTAIAFNHTSHFNKYFVNPKYTDKVPPNSCIGCHDYTKSTNNVPIKGFQETCSKCHTDTIVDRPMVLFTFPELELTATENREKTKPHSLFGENRDEVMERLEELTTALSGEGNESGASLKATLAELATIPKLGVRAGKKSALQALAQHLRNQLTALSESAITDNHKEALAKLTGPAAIIAKEAVEAISDLNEDRFGELSEQLDALAELVEEASDAIGEDLGENVFEGLSNNIALMTAQLEELEEDEEYEPVSSETLSPIMAGLLGVDDDDTEQYKKPVLDMVDHLKNEGISALSELISKNGGSPNRMLQGLSNELISAAATSWSNNLEYEAIAEPSTSGWYADEFSIKYRPTTHRDTVMKAWLDFASNNDNEYLQEALLSRKEGAGACTKCHAVSQITPAKAKPGDAAHAKTAIEWGPFQHPERQLVKYDHKPHINLLGPGSSCTTCHKINDKADFEAAYQQTDPNHFASNFQGIEKSTCAECHNEKQVRQNCLLCHAYHQGSGIKVGVVSKMMKER